MDGSDNCYIHHYLTATDRFFLICSFAYDRDLLDDELSVDDVKYGLEEVDGILNSLTFR